MNPIKEIHQHLVSLHCYSTDRSRAVPSHHFCSPAPTKGVRQCIIYDSDKSDDRLIGIEYIIDVAVFDTLDNHEKHLWHSRELGFLLPYIALLNLGRLSHQTSTRSRAASFSSALAPSSPAALRTRPGRRR
jgi:hypothetical protein